MGLAHKIEEGMRTNDVKISQGVTFGSMLLAPETLQGLQNSGFYKPSPIQLHAIPLGKCGFDLILEAKSGTGKTAVFSVIALESLDLNKGLQTIILAPTREIAAQICDVIKQIGSCYEGLQVEVVMGGLPVQDDIVKFKKPVHILVGSPGRLKQLVQEKYVNVSSVRLLVFDEADRLVEKSFLSDINYIFSQLPQQKQVIMSSATYPKTTKEAINQYLRNPQHICPDTDSILLGIEQRIVLVKHNSNIIKQTNFRFEEMIKILSRKPFKQCLIFCNYQARVGEVRKMLIREKWPAEQLYGSQDQTDRLDALKTLQDYGCRILVTTDLAARGIDASNVDLVINFEPPFIWQTYLHRIGRAGRYGSYGTAVTILSEGKEENKFKTMLEEIKGSINLRNFWDDEIPIPDVNLNITSTTETKSNHDEFTKDGMETREIFQILWNTYTAPSKNDTKELEIFDDLCKSFEEETNECEVESFTDLVNSFNLHDHNTKASEDIKYKHVSQPDIPVAEYDGIIKNLYLKTGLASTPNKNELQRDEHSKVDTENENLQENCVTVTNNGNSTIQSPTLHSPTVNETNNLVNGDCASDDDPELTAALLKAGLPTAFASTKDLNKKKVFKPNKSSFTDKNTFKPVQSKTNQNNTITNNIHNNNPAESRCNTNNTMSKDSTCKYINPKSQPVISGTNENTLNTVPSNKADGAPRQFVTLKNQYLRRSEPSTSMSVPYNPKSNNNHEVPQRILNGNNTLKQTMQNYDYHIGNNCENYFTNGMADKSEHRENLTHKQLKTTDTSYMKYDKWNKTNESASKAKKYQRTVYDDSDSTSSEESTLPSEYVNWYRMLKYRTMQMEQAFYVHELAKL